MATGWERLGQVLGGGGAAREDAYRGRMIENAQGDRAMQLARQASLDTRRAESRIAAEQSLADAILAAQSEDPMVQAKGLAGIGIAERNPNQFASSVARQRETNTRNRIEQSMLDGNVEAGQAGLASLSSSPLVLPGEVGGYVVSNRYDPDSLAEAINAGQVGARIPSQVAADEALAGQRNASAARTRALPLTSGRDGGEVAPDAQARRDSGAEITAMRMALQQSGGDRAARERIYARAVARGFAKEAGDLMPDIKVDMETLTDFRLPVIPAGDVFTGDYLPPSEVDRLTLMEPGDPRITGGAPVQSGPTPAPPAIAAPQSQLPVVTDQAQYDALPVGALYMEADGQTYRKR